MDEFPCTQCGLCCKQVGKALQANFQDPFTAFLLSKFPYKAKEDGSCEMLKDNLCTVYEDRPLICNITLLAKARGRDITEYHREQAEHCNELIIREGLDPKYLVYIE